LQSARASSPPRVGEQLKTGVNGTCDRSLSGIMALAELSERGGRGRSIRPDKQILGVTGLWDDLWDDHLLDR
jgi:hypothetical protein